MGECQSDLLRQSLSTGPSLFRIYASLYPLCGHIELAERVTFLLSQDAEKFEFASHPPCEVVRRQQYDNIFLL